MFETRADVMAMFEQFRTVDKADLGTNQSLENHALLVITSARTSLLRTTPCSWWPRHEPVSWEPRLALDDLGTNQSLENHALLVMNALDEAITNMDDPEFLIEMLLTTGKSHQRFENFSMQIFWVNVFVCSYIPIKSYALTPVTWNVTHLQALIFIRIAVSWR